MIRRSRGGLLCGETRARWRGGRLWRGGRVSDVSIACRQVGPIRFKEPVPLQEDAFNERRSLIFKTLRGQDGRCVAQHAGSIDLFGPDHLRQRKEFGHCGDRGPSMPIPVKR